MRIVAAFIGLALTQPCLAQPTAGGVLNARPQNPQIEGWSVTVGAAPIVGPAWQGSRDTVISIFPDLRVNFGDTAFASVPEGIGWNALNQGGWKAGPIVKVRFGRDEDGNGSPFVISGHSDALIGLGNIGAAAELGGFVEKRFGKKRQWSARVEARRGFGGHEGMVGDASFSYRLRSGRMIANVGPRISIASSDLAQTYFGIDAEQSAQSGLPLHRAKGGIVSYGLGGSLIRPLDSQSAITLFTSLEGLGSAAASSPLIRERGQKTQFTLGLGYGYRFGF